MTNKIRQCLLLLITIIMLPMTASADAVEIDGIYYNLSIEDNTAQVTKVGRASTYSGDVIIPQEVIFEDVKYKVTSIFQQAFVSAVGLTSITLPNTIEEIGYRAFCNCTSLTTITIPNSVKSLGDEFLYGCSSLHTIILPESLTSIPNGAFRSCTNLLKIKIPSNCKFIGGSAFLDCTYLSSIDIPSTVDEIGGSAFYGCTNLLSIKLPEGLTIINGECFKRCKNLQVINIPQSVKSIGSGAFEGCVNLKEIIIPEGVENIGWGAFQNCRSLVNLYIPNTVTTIGDLEQYYGSTFQGCSELKTIHLSEKITIIPYYAFQDCLKLETINIPESITEIGEYAFANCQSLKDVALPEGITTIRKSTFEFCYGLQKIIIPSTTNIINPRAFACCYADTVISLAINPPLLYADSFYDYDNTCDLFVPKESTAKYKEDNQWGRFRQILEYELLSKCRVDITFSEGGIILLNDKKIENEYGEFINRESFLTLKILPKDGYYIKSILINGVEHLNDISTEGILSINLNENIVISILFDTKTYSLIYLINNIEYKSYKIKYGVSIIPEPAPAKEGYTFSGWSEIPETMPARDVTVTGTFTTNKYKLSYIVDGEVYKTYEIEYGASITPEENPTKEGYTFSGWSEIPETMPAHDVEITGTFTEIVKTDPGLGITSNEQFIEQLGFIATLGQPFNSPELINTNGLSPIVWTSSHPEVASVDGNGILTIKSVGTTQIVASFAGNNQYEAGIAEYSLFVKDANYEINDDGTVSIAGGDKAGEVTIETTVEINGWTFNVTAIAEDAFKGNQNISSVSIPEGITSIGNNAFANCSGLIVINIGKDVQTIGSRAFANVGTASARTRSEESTIVVNCYTESVPQTSSDAFENTPIKTGKLLVNDNLVNAYKSTYPWSEFGKIYAFNDPAGINGITIGTANAWIFDMLGNRLDNVRKGVNILRDKDGKTKKVMVK